MKMRSVLLMHHMFKFIHTVKKYKDSTTFLAIMILCNTHYYFHTDKPGGIVVSKSFTPNKIIVEMTSLDFEQLPSIKYFAFINEYPDMEVQLLQKVKSKRDTLL